MPVAGLPTAVETSLNALLSENYVSSWKIVGEGDSAVFVLRLKPTQANKTTTNMAPSMPVHYRKKPPSQINRDNNRARQRQDLRNRQNQEVDNKASGSTDSLFTSPIFVNEEQCMQQYDTNRPTTTDTTTAFTIGTRNMTVISDSGGGEGGLDSCATELSTECGAVGYDIERGLPFDPLPFDIRPELDPRVTKARELGYEAGVVESYVSTLMDKSLQRQLRNTNRNNSFLKVALDSRGERKLLFESDDIVLEYAFRGDYSRTHTSFWYVKQQRQHMLPEEDEKQQTLSRLNDVGDGRYLKARAEAERELHILRDLICYFLG